MWYPATVSTAISAEPVTVDEAKKRLHIDGIDDDADLLTIISQARAHLEQRTGTRLAPQGLTVKCDCFDDLARLPTAPITAVASISYIDTAGNAQTLSNTVYELRADGLEAAIVLKYGQQWPGIQSGSRITIVLTAGYTELPPDLKGALLLLVGHWYENREASISSVMEIPIPIGVDDLVCNHRRGI